MQFNDIWVSDLQLAKLADLARSTASVFGEVIEVGVWQGRSAVTLANAVYPDTLHCVDHWKGSEVDGITRDWGSYDWTKNYEVFLANMDEGTAGNFVTWKMGWQEFAPQWDQPIRFLHVDGAHTREEVAGNIKALIPYAMDDAIFCGDDWPYTSVQEGVYDVFTHEAVHHPDPVPVWDAKDADKLWWVKVTEEALR